MKDLQGKVAVVTGAASGIGRASALAFAAEGMDVLVADIDLPGAEQVAATITGMGRRALAQRVDVAKAADVQAMLDRVLAHFGACHLVMNNAGIAIAGQSWELSEDDWRRTIDVDLWGVIHGTRLFAQHFVKQGEGHIVNTASAAGLMAVPGLCAYTTAKFGVVGLSEGFRWELAAEGVGVTVVCPGVIATNIGRASEYRGKFAKARERGVEGIDKGVPPEKLARKIVAAVRNNEAMVLAGREAWAIAAMRRLPSGASDLLGRTMAKTGMKMLGG